MRRPGRKFWSFQNSADDANTAILTLYGNISETSWYEDDITPNEFAKDLAAVGPVSNIIVRLNSGGGDVFAAVAIGNQLEQHPAHTVCRIDGLCASAATIIACHCDEVEAAADAAYMMHLPAVGLLGYYNEQNLQKMQEPLQTIKSNTVALYCRKSGMEADAVTALIEATTWWTAAQAKDNGFIDSIVNEAVSVEDRAGVLFVNSVSTGLPFEEAPEFVKDSSTAAPAGNCVSDKDPAGPGTTQTNKEDKQMDHNEIKTAQDLRAAYPDLVKQIEDAAAQNATTAERQRIHSIEDMALPGSEELTANAKYGDQTMSAEEYAMALVKDAKAKGAAYMKAATDDAAGAGKVGNDKPDDADSFMQAIRATGSKQ